MSRAIIVAITVSFKGVAKMKKTFYVVKVMNGLVFFTSPADAEKACNVFTCDSVAVMRENGLTPYSKIYHRRDMTNAEISLAKEFKSNIFVGDGEILPCNQ
jgi:hypothetical protein